MSDPSMPGGAPEGWLGRIPQPVRFATIWVAERPVIVFAIATLLLSLVFILLPRLDLWFSRGFYDPETGFFPASRIPFAIWLREAANTVMWIIALALIATVILKIALPQRASAVQPRTVAFFLTSLVLGPGLLVNGFLKEISGRPRPIDIADFGGESPFVPAWQFTDYCATNCSFVAGEASAAIWLVVLVVVAPPRWRRAVLVATLAFATLVSLNRIAFGGHFLSDVLISWGLTLFVIAVVHYVLFVVPPAFLTNDAMEAGLTRLGLWLRRSVERGAKILGPAPIPADRNRTRRDVVMWGEGEEGEDDGQRPGNNRDGHGGTP
ncbi:MAG: phosphatase PAP2 family protein [Bauldia sp.]|nr:phosphatase PAP2 family protein [Bauldia sp.]